MNDDIFSSLHTEKPYALDITPFKEKGEALKKTIDLAVKDTQSVIVRSYPNKLIMTLNQYNDLTGKPGLLREEYEGQEFFLYRTPYNIMEVEIEDGA